MKPLHEALRDGDTVRGIIRNTGVNQDGKTSGITLPSRQAQESLIQTVYDKAGLNPLDTSYVECHGTGTPAGDPLETAAISHVFGHGRSHDQPLHIGSVKTNIGHLEGASGVAGIIKSILMLENQTILPNRNFRNVNKNIPLYDWKLKVIIIQNVILESTANSVRYQLVPKFGRVTVLFGHPSTASATGEPMPTLFWRKLVAT